MNTPVLDPVLGGGFSLLRIAQLSDALGEEEPAAPHIIIWTYCQVVGVMRCR